MSDFKQKQVLPPRHTTQLPKRELQALLKGCRKCGYEVEKSNGIYYVVDPRIDELVLRALDGRRSYLVSASDSHFERFDRRVEA